MMRFNQWTLAFLLVLLVGCHSERTDTNEPAPPSDPPGDTAVVDPPVDETNGTIGGENSGPKANGESVEKPSPGVSSGPAIDPAEIREMAPDELAALMSDATNYNAASDVLVGHGADAVTPLAALLETDNATVKSAIFTLGRLGKDAESALPALQEIAESGETEALRDGARFAIDAIQGEPLAR